MKRILYIFIQCTWGAVQSIMGAGLMLLLGKQKHFRGPYRCAILTEYNSDTLPRCMRTLGSVSLGMFIFVNATRGEDNANRTAAHEYGHTIQSILLGPLYLFIVGIPSFLWCKYYSRHRAEYTARGIDYCSRFPEKQATYYGNKLCSK